MPLPKFPRRYNNVYSMCFSDKYTLPADACRLLSPVFESSAGGFLLASLQKCAATTSLSYKHGSDRWYAMDYSRDKAFYAISSSLSYADTIHAADFLISNNFCESKSGYYDHAKKEGRRSLLVPTPEFNKFLSTAPRKAPNPKLLLQLRDKRRKRIEYSPSRETRRMRRLLEDINEMLSRHQFSMNLDFTEMSTKDVETLSGAYLVDGQTWAIGPLVHYNRVFNDTWGCNGRFYSPVQRVPSRFRCNFRIDGEPTSQVDLSSSALRLAYADAKVEVTNEDLYSLPGFERDDVKIATQIALNTSSYWKALHAVEKHVSPQAEALLGALLKLNAPISDRFFECRGLRLMYTESRITSRLFRYCVEHDLPAINIHDGWVVPVGRREEFIGVFKDVYREVAKVEPVLKETEPSACCPIPLTSKVL